MTKFYSLLGFATVVTVTNAWNKGAPQYAANKRRASKALGMPHHQLRPPSKQSAHDQTTTVLNQVLHGPKYSASTVPRYPTATTSAASGIGNEPPPLSPEEHEMLMTFYQSMGGPNWHTKDGWMNSSNPCGSGSAGSSWVGVECTKFEINPFSLSHVTGLVLPHNNLIGEVPPLSSLQHLLYVDFSNPSSTDSYGLSNLVDGTLDVFCGLDSLSTVLLNHNNFNGSIPACLQTLANARTLNFNYNTLQGTIPDELCSLRNLRKLLLYDTALTGTIPSCLGSLSHLTVLELADNQFHGPIPEELCNASALEFLTLSENSMTGTLPSCLGNLSHVKVLELYTNQFHGPIPDEFCQVSRLVYLSLFENALTGTLPSCLGSLRWLIYLELETNQFHGSIPEELCQANGLHYLRLSENALTGTLPHCLGSLKQLTSLELNTNHFHGPIPEELCEASALEILLLNDNSLTGTLPSCLGNLSQLYELVLDTNQFCGSVPEMLCQVSALELLFLYSNVLTGSLPHCLATSFQLLEAMLLHDNDIAGEIPLEWASPSLVSIMLSNNPKLSGSLSASFFLEQGTSNDTQFSKVVLRDVVIEGTSIGGTLPAALCSAPQLVTLALSGNKLTGSLPNCIVSLQNLRTLRFSNNRLTGTLPVAINNMTSLTVLDLSNNLIQGRIPAGLGDISQNLEAVDLQINRLSCDLPASVLNWQASSENTTVSLLNGNTFGCSTKSIFALSIQGAAGLRNVNEQAFDAYSCGNSKYVLPVIFVAILAVPVVFGLLFVYFRGRLALHWRVPLELTINPSILINELDNADEQIKALAFGVMAAATLSGSVALVLSVNVATSAFECEYMGAPTLANKGESNERTLSVAIGAVVSVGLTLGLALWWRRLFSKCVGIGTSDYGGINVEDKPLDGFEEDDEAWESNAERIAESIPRKPTDAISRALKLLLLTITLVILSIGPNVGYVWVALSQLTLEQKVASEMAVTLAKTGIGTLLVPKVARKAVDLVVLNGALTFVRFRLRMAIATALSAVTMIVLPVMIVLVTDKRCLYYVFYTKPAVHTDVPVLTCLNAASNGHCYEYDSNAVTSTYMPSFAYDGEVCVSAVLSVYGSVFLGVVLLSATLPAGMEILIVPWLAPWCYRNTESSTVARMGLAFLRAVTWNVWPALAEACVLAPDFSLGVAKLDNLAQRVVERAFVQVMVTLLVALTFGIAVPLVGGTCAIAAFVQLLHHRHVLGQIVALGRLEQPAVVPNLFGCTDVPLSGAVVVAVTVVLVWVCGTIAYLEPIVIGVTLMIGPILVVLAANGGTVWRRSSRSKALSHRDREQSIGSSCSPQGLLMESLIPKE